MKTLNTQTAYQLTREIMQLTKILDELYPNQHSLNLHIAIMMKFQEVWEKAYTYGARQRKKRKQGQPQ
jgi:hypothetical protein